MKNLEINDIMIKDLIKYKPFYKEYVEIGCLM